MTDTERPRKKPRPKRVKITLNELAILLHLQMVKGIANAYFSESYLGRLTEIGLIRRHPSDSGGRKHFYQAVLTPRGEKVLEVCKDKLRKPLFDIVVSEIHINRMGLAEIEIWAEEKGHKIEKSPIAPNYYSLWFARNGGWTGYHLRDLFIEICSYAMELEKGGKHLEQYSGRTDPPPGPRCIYCDASIDICQEGICDACRESNEE